MAIRKVAVHGIIMANKPWTWIVSFMKIIKYWKPSWESNYGVIYKDKIKAGTFLFRK